MFGSSLTLVAILAVMPLCNQGVLAKELIVELDKFETLKEYGNEWVDWKTLAMEKVGRNQFAIKGDFSLKMNVGDKQRFMVQAYRDPDGKKHGPPVFTIVRSVCAIMREYKKTYEGLAAASNMPKEVPCPMPKNDYHIENYVLDTSFLPEGTPPGEYLLVATIKDGEKSVAAFQMYITVSVE